MNRPTRNSMLCPNCRKLISTDEKRCPHCGLPTPGSPWKNNPLTRSWGSGEQLVKIVIYTNIAMYLLALLLNPRLTGFGFNPFSLLSPSTNSLIALGATGISLMDKMGGWWTLIAANYLHGSILHIFFNLMVVYQISPLVIQLYGPHRYFIIYTCSGAAGFLVSYMAGVQITIGASAALFGLIGASLYYGKARGGPFGQAIYKQIGGWALIMIAFGFLIPRINNWAHIGGLTFGVVLSLLLGYREKQSESRLHRWISGLLVVLTAGALGWGVLRGFFYFIGK